MPEADAEILALSQEMTISREAFLRSLALALGHGSFRFSDGIVEPLDDGERWRIVLAPLPDMALGALSLPRQHVELYLRGYSAARRQRFLERFELAFRRAGG